MIRERADRLAKIYSEIDVLLREVGPRLIKIAHLREEARVILAENADATRDRLVPST